MDAVAGVGKMLAPAVVGGGGCDGLLGAEVGEAGAEVLGDDPLAAVSSGVAGAEVLTAAGGDNTSGAAVTMMGLVADSVRLG